MSEDDAHDRPDEIDAKISKAQEQRQEWQDDKQEFTKMRKGGKDPQEIYDWEENWDFLWDKVWNTVEEGRPDESPASTRECLNKDGWTDDKIWAAHIDICTEQMDSQTQTIQDLQKQKRDNELALQVRKKIGCIPDAYDLDRLLKYEGSIERQFYKAIDQLERLQRLRAGDNVPAPINIDVAVDTENAG